MEQVYGYKSYVDEDNIKSNGDLAKNIRYLLRVPLKNSGEKVLVIMKNPSKADDKKSDLTIDRLLKFCNSQNYSEVIVMNLFSYYSPYPKDITNLIDNGKLDEAIRIESDKIMKEVLKEVKEVIVAWGGNLINRARKYKSRIRQVTRMIKGKEIYYVQSMSKDTYYPRHPQTWAVNQGIAKYKWEPKFKF